jgi:hypothetical protein
MHLRTQKARKGIGMMKFQNKWYESFGKKTWEW